jgi:hypothetical protein
MRCVKKTNETLALKSQSQKQKEKEKKTIQFNAATNCTNELCSDYDSLERGAAHATADAGSTGTVSL